MSGRVEVTRRMSPWGGVTAPDVAAFATESQRNPWCALSQAVLTRIGSDGQGKAGERQTDKVLADGPFTGIEVNGLHSAIEASA